jgi:hypothetical protein
MSRSEQRTNVVDNGATNITLVEATWARVVSIWAAHLVGSMLLGLFISPLIAVFLNLAIPKNLLSAQTAEAVTEMIAFPLAGLLIFRMLLSMRLLNLRIVLVPSR